MLLATLLSGLGGCSRKAVAPAAPATQPTSAPPAAAVAPTASSVTTVPPEVVAYAPLMQAVFGAAYRAAQGDAIVDLPDPDQPSRSLHLTLAAVDMERLPSGDTVLVVAGEHANAAGFADSAHVDGGYLSLYLLRQENSQWKLIRRHDNVANLGSSGNMGELRWIDLAQGKPGIAVLHGGVWQGYAITMLSLFDPAAEQVRDLAGAIPVQSDNEGACGPKTQKCWEAEAKWTFAPAATPGGHDDLVLTFTGEERTTHGTPASADPAQGVERDVRPLHGAARYLFERGAYRLRTGENLIPGI